jgi:hypothetical protein
MLEEYIDIYKFGHSYCHFNWIFWNKLGKHKIFCVSTVRIFLILNKIINFVGDHLSRAKNGWQKSCQATKTIQVASVRLSTGFLSPFRFLRNFSGVNVSWANANQTFSLHTISLSWHFLAWHKPPLSQRSTARARNPSEVALCPLLPQASAKSTQYSSCKESIRSSTMSLTTLIMCQIVLKYTI